MKLEKLAFATLYKNRDMPMNNKQIAAWNVWTMRGTWKAKQFAEAFILASAVTGRFVTAE